MDEYRWKNEILSELTRVSNIPHCYVVIVAFGVEFVDVTAPDDFDEGSADLLRDHDASCRFWSIVILLRRLIDWNALSGGSNLLDLLSSSAFCDWSIRLGHIGCESHVRCNRCRGCHRLSLFGDGLHRCTVLIFFCHYYFLVKRISFSSLFLILNYNFNDKFVLTTDKSGFPTSHWFNSQGNSN